MSASPVPVPPHAHLNLSVYLRLRSYTVEMLIFDAGVSVYASLMVAALFFGGLQFVDVDAPDENVGRIYNAVRPSLNCIVLEERAFDH